jgi:hypothetical protein
MLLAAPVSPLRKLIAKLLVPVFFFVPLASLIVLGFKAAGVVGWDFVATAAWLAACAVVVGGAAGLLLGVLHTDWEWDNPRRMLKVSGRLLMLAIIVIFFVIIAGTLGMPGPGKEATDVGNRLARIAAMTGPVAAIATYVLLRIAAARLRAMEWNG